MIAELKSLGIELMVSIWPTVDRESENWNEMLSKGLLIRQDRSWRASVEWQGGTVHFDATNPEARKYVWKKAKAHYYDKGVKVFWLDEAEPEYSVSRKDILATWSRFSRSLKTDIGKLDIRFRYISIQPRAELDDWQLIPCRLRPRLLRGPKAGRSG